MTINTISVGVDRSDLSVNALTWALGLAAFAGAEVRAITTWQMPLICQLPGQITGVPSPEWMEADSLTTLEGAIDSAESRVVDAPVVRRLTIEGKPGPALVAASRGSDLLFIGRTGYGKRFGIARAAQVALGSTARHCLHEALVPVVTMPAGTEWNPKPAVAVGVDGSDNSLAALAWALVSLPTESQVFVVRSYEPWFGDGLVPEDLENDPSISRMVRAETQSWVDEVLTQVSRPVAQPEILTLIGTAQHALTHTGLDVDLVVVGKRSRSRLAAAVMGSVSDYLVRYCTAPVVVVP